MYSQDHLLPLSALQHLHFCPRQCALIHIERQWLENRFTAEGREIHRVTDQPSRQTRGAIRRATGLLIRSLRLGLSGKADVVEFHRRENGAWIPFPVEYKRGQPKPDNCDRVQLCAQAMCLEEMLEIETPEGALFYGKTRRRQDVRFDAALRGETERLAAELHALIESGETPLVGYSAKCDRCSLWPVCRPRTVGARSAAGYLKRMVKEATCSDC